MLAPTLNFARGIVVDSHVLPIACSAPYASTYHGAKVLGASKIKGNPQVLGRGQVQKSLVVRATATSPDSKQSSVFPRYEGCFCLVI